MPKVAKDEKLHSVSRSTRKSFKKKCEAMIPKDETGQPKLKIAGRYKVCLGLGLKMGVLDIGVEARRVSIIRTNQKVRKSVQKQMEPFHNDDFNLDPFLRFKILLLTKLRKHTIKAAAVPTCSNDFVCNWTFCSLLLFNF